MYSLQLFLVSDVFIAFSVLLAMLGRRPKEILIERIDPSTIFEHHTYSIDSICRTAGLSGSKQRKTVYQVVEINDAKKTHTNT